MIGAVLNVSAGCARRAYSVSSFAALNDAAASPFHVAHQNSQSQCYSGGSWNSLAVLELTCSPSPEYTSAAHLKSRRIADVWHLPLHQSQCTLRRVEETSRVHGRESFREESENEIAETHHDDAALGRLGVLRVRDGFCSGGEVADAEKPRHCGARLRVGSSQLRGGARENEQGPHQDPAAPGWCTVPRPGGAGGSRQRRRRNRNDDGRLLHRQARTDCDH